MLLFFLHSRHDNVFENSFPVFIKYAFSALQHITVDNLLYPNYVMPIHLIRHSQRLFKNIDILILSLFSCVFDWRVVNLKWDGLWKPKEENKEHPPSTSLPKSWSTVHDYWMDNATFCSFRMSLLSPVFLIAPFETTSVWHCGSSALTFTHSYAKVMLVMQM